MRHEEDNTTQPETETGAGNVRRSLGVSALRDEIPEKARSEPGNAGTDGPSRRRGAMILRPPEDVYCSHALRVCRYLYTFVSWFWIGIVFS